jgi:SAM-dependent methyltransferase
MGLGIAAVQNTLELSKLGLLEGINKIVEMGSQELHLTALDLEEMIKMAGLNNFQKNKFPDIDNWPNSPRCSAKSFYQFLGIKEYVSIDTNKDHESISLDFNLPLEDTSLYSQFDLVTDHGACEHAFNIAETYRTMHRLCKPKGLIVIAQSLWGGNGYFLYDESFFDGIAAANNYKIIFNSYVIATGSKTPNGSDNQFHIPLNRDLLKTIDLSKTSIGVYVVLQKQDKSDFKFPYQGQYLAKKQGHFGFNRIYHQNPLSSSFIPEVEITTLTGREFIKEFFRRIKTRIINK